MKTKVLEILKPIIVLTLIAAVMAALLGGTDLLTREKIAEITKENEKLAVEKVIKAEKYEAATVLLDGAEYNYYTALTNDECVGYAFSVSANGYGGIISSVIGISQNGTVLAVEITSADDETPGLGQNVKKESFLSQFKDVVSKVLVVKNGATESEVNAVTGATISSTAVSESVNKALSLYNAVKEAA